MKDELQLMKWWLDAEISINHAYYWAILGAVIGGKFWIVAGIGIAVSLVYSAKRAVKLPRHYLSVKGKK